MEPPVKITEVEALYLRLPEIQARTDSSQDALIVQVSTDTGITGWGEVDGCPYVTKAIIEAPMLHTLVTGLRALLLGEDPLETLRLWQKMYERTLYYGREGAVIQAMAGIDLALWDIKGKAFSAAGLQAAGRRLPQSGSGSIPRRRPGAGGRGPGGRALARGARRTRPGAGGPDRLPRAVARGRAGQRSWLRLGPAAPARALQGLDPARLPAGGGARAACRSLQLDD
jgi:hypothetical protein